MNTTIFLILNLTLAFYNVGTIWAHEIDIFRSWKLVDRASFHRIQRSHWRKLPFWVFVPVFLALLGSLGLIGYHPQGSPKWGIWGSFVTQFASLLLTATLFGPWQAALSKDERGPESPHLARILRTHWIRTLLINANAFILLFWIVEQSRGVT